MLISKVEVSLKAVLPPFVFLAHDLVAWYEESVMRYLNAQAGKLIILTPGEVAQTFAPAQTKAGHKEVTAATRALEQLASKGVLCCQWVEGELRCLND